MTGAGLGLPENTPPQLRVRAKVRYREAGALKNADPQRLSPPRPTQRPGTASLFGIPCPCPCSGPCSGPRPTHIADGSLFKISGNKQVPIQGMNAGGPRTGMGGDYPKNTPPGPVYGQGLACEKRPCPAQLWTLVRAGPGTWKPAQPSPVTNTSNVTSMCHT